MTGEDNSFADQIYYKNKTKKKLKSSSVIYNKMTQIPKHKYRDDKEKDSKTNNSVEKKRKLKEENRAQNLHR